MNAESLHLTSEEFDDYTTGKRVPPKRNSINNTVKFYRFFFFFFKLK